MRDRVNVDGRCAVEVGSGKTVGSGAGLITESQDSKEVVQGRLMANMSKKPSPEWATGRARSWRVQAVPTNQSRWTAREWPT